MSKPLIQRSGDTRAKLRETREAKGWSQEQLALLLGTGQVTVSRWETGETTPSPYFRKKLTQLLGKTPEELDLVPGIDQRTPNSSSILDPLTPPPPQTFIGRKNDLLKVKGSLLTSSRLVAVYGLPGVGKTTIAAALAHDGEIRTRFSDGVLWVGLGTAPDIIGQLQRWGTLLGLSTRPDLKNPDDLALAVRTSIGSQRMLIVIDDAWKVEDALMFAIGGPGCVHLVTTRFPVIAAHICLEGGLALRELPLEGSIALLHALAPLAIEHEPEKARSLAQVAGGLPLALTLIGHHLRTSLGHPRRIQSALEQLTSASNRLNLSLSQSPVERHPGLVGHDLTLQAAISLSDEYLTIKARQALYSLSVLPPKPDTFSEVAALAVSQSSEKELDALMDAGLLESAGDGSYSLHQVIADYAHLHLNDPQPTERLIRYALALMKQHPDDYEILDAEYSTILAALEAAYEQNQQRNLIEATDAFAKFLLLRGSYVLAERHLHRAYEAARTLNDTAGQADILLHLGELARHTGDYLRARDHIEEGLVLARQIDDHPQHLCALLALQGHILNGLGAYEAAIAISKEGLQIARTLGNQEQVCDLLNVIATIEEQRGNYAEAELCFQEGIALARQTANFRLLGRHLNNYGTCCGFQGNIAQAVQLFQEGLAIARQIGDEHQICSLLGNLGEFARFAGEVVQAEAHYLEGLTLARKLGTPEWMGCHLSNLAELLMERGNYEQAGVYLEEARSCAQTARAHRLWSYVLLHSALAALYQGKTTEAEAFLQEMQPLIPTGDVELHSMLNYGYARLAWRQGDMGTAYALGQASLTALEAVGHYKAHEIRIWLASLPIEKEEKHDG